MHSKLLLANSFKRLIRSSSLVERKGRKKIQTLNENKNTIVMKLKQSPPSFSTAQTGWLKAQAGKAIALGLKVSPQKNLICFRFQGHKGLKKI